jgi:hypothetical protein
MDKKAWPLSDLSFFRFPEVTPDVVRNILLLLLLLAVTVLVTMLVQRWVMERAHRSEQKRTLGRRLREHRGDGAVQALLGRLVRASGLKDEYELSQDAVAFETAAEQLAGSASEAELGDLHRVRQLLHMNVMNPALALVSTRQLLPDLPVRLLANLGSEKLDLYCALVSVNEQSLLVNVPQQEEVFRLLCDHPEVFLLVWREKDGETAFRIRLEPVGEGALSLFRARHALRDPEAQRATFRLLLDDPLEFTYLEREQMLARRKGVGSGPGAEPAQVVHGQGRLMDISYGGASFSVSQPLAEGGFAQLRFTLHEQPMRLMLQVLSCTGGERGSYLVRGRFRGQGEEVHIRLNHLLLREQIKRLREKEVIRVRAEV